MTFGNMQWGTDEAESHRIVDSFLDAGHNFIDTADVYNAGHRKKLFGWAIAKKRSDVILATKGYNVMGSGPNDQGSSRAHLTSAWRPVCGAGHRLHRPLPTAQLGP